MGQTSIRTDEEGNHFAAKVVRKITDKDAENQIKFTVEILSFNEVSQQDNDSEVKCWTFS